MTDATKPWEQDYSTGSDAPWTQDYGPDAENAPAAPRGFKGWARDIAATAVKSAIGAPELAVGLADIPTGGAVGKFLENEGGSVGFRPKEAREIVNQWHSNATLEAQRKFQEADGVLAKAATAIRNPSLIATGIGESLTPMGVGGVIGRGILRAAPKVAPWVAGGLGEGVAAGGSAAEQIRQETDDGRLTPKQAALAGATIATTGAFGALGGKIANRLGIGEAETMLAQGMKGLDRQAADRIAAASTNPLVAQAALKSIPRKIIEGAISEGFLEELPQELTEQLLQNLALGDPWHKDLDASAVMGVLTGGAMGAGASGFRSWRDRQAEKAQNAAPPKAPTVGGNMVREAVNQTLLALPAPVIDVDSTGTARTAADRNARLQRQADMATPAPLALPAPTINVSGSGSATTAADRNAQLQQDAADRAARMPRIATGEVLDITPIAASESVIDPGPVTDVTPSEAAGLRTDAGPLENAAALAVDTGATMQMQQTTMFDAPPSGSYVDPETGEIGHLPVEQWSDEQLSAAFRAAQAPSVRRSLAEELSRRRDAQEQERLQAELAAEQAGGEFDAEPDDTFARMTEDPGPAPDPDEIAGGMPATMDGARTNGKKAAQAKQGDTSTTQGGRTAAAAPEAGAVVDAGGSAASAAAAVQQQPDVGALRQQLRAVEDRIIAAAPGHLQAGGGSIEAAMKSRKVPVTLKAERKRLKDQIAAAEAPVAPPKLKRATREDLDHLFGIDKKREAALQRVNSDKGAFFMSQPKAQEFIKKNGLSDTHTLVQRGKSWHVVAKPAGSAAAADTQPPVASIFTGEPDPRNSAPLESLEGFKPGDSVDVPSRTTGRSTVELVFRQQMKGVGEVSMARVASADGKKLDLLLSEITHADSGPSATNAADVTAAAHEAATSQKNDLPAPTEGQIEAGNYKKGHVTINGLDISIENPAGSKRRPEWPALKHHYGYIRGSVGADKDHVDVFMTDQAHDASLPVFVVDQVNADGSFDEHKVVLGAANEQDAREAYLANYEKGWTGLGAITQMTQDEFKEWVRNPTKTRKALGEFTPPPASAGDVATIPVDQPDRRAEAKPKKKAARKPTAEQTRAKADLMNALADLGDILGKDVRKSLMPEQEQKLLPVLTRVLDAAFRLGYHKFKNAAKFALDQIREHIGDAAADALTIDHLQGAYIAMAGGKKGVDTKRAVIDIEDKAEIEAHEATPDVVENDTIEGTTPDGDQTKGESDERTAVSGDGPQALDEVATEEGGGPEGQRGTGAGTADGRKKRAEGSAGSDESGVPATRGGRSGTGAVHPSKTGTRSKSGAVGTQGVGQSGPGVSGNDGRVEVPGGEASAPNIPAANFQITDALDLGKGGEVAKFNDNLAAIRALKRIEAEGRRATPEEQALLARYVGWGGLASAFPNPVTGAYKERWDARGKELRDLLTKEEHDAARRSTRNAHYTSQTVVSAMWDMVRRLGYRGGLVLESSMGTGNFLGLAPADMAHRFVGVEYDSLTARISQALYPQATVLHSGFQQVPVADNAFMLNIGNPPFGNESLRFQYKPELQGVSIHNQFFRAGMDALRPGGLQAMVVSRYLMDAQDPGTRLALAQQARLVAAFRLPDTAFKENARTEVVTDILIFQKLDADEQARMREGAVEYRKRGANKKDLNQELVARIPSWVETTRMPDPLGGEPMVVNAYFRENPRNILGVLERSGTMQHGADITVRLDNPADLAEMLRKATDTLPENIQDFGQQVLDDTAARHKSMSDALRIAVVAEEAGYVKRSPDGLQRVIERETPEGDFEFAYQAITADSPWHESLGQDAQGRWYVLEPVLDAEGNKVKVVDKAGKVTRRNLYERKVFEKLADVPASMRLGKVGMQRLEGLVELRDLLKRQLVLETADAAKAVMEGNRKTLAAAYAAFVKKNGPVNRPTNMRLAMTMPDGGLVAALEVGYQPARSAAQSERSGLPVQPETAEAAAILNERVVPKYEPATKASSPADALAITLAERGRVDMERIANLLGVNPQEAASQLQDRADPLVFHDPETQTWETADAYLSGLVRRKLNAARAANMPLNVKALEKVIPEPWTAENVTATMGAAWVPADVYASFLSELTGGKARVSFAPLTNTFGVKLEGASQAKMNEWSSEGVKVDYIVSRILNSKPVTVTQTDKDGNVFVDKERTELAGLKAREIEAEFGDWVFKDFDRRARLVEIFNEKNNIRVVRQFNGQHLQLPGKVPDAIIEMRRHQSNVIWRGIYERFMLMDHAVGAGKTFSAIARAMERRRMGLSRKPMIAVPNHLVEQWAADVYRLYPAAKVLAAGKKDFETKRRRRLFGKIATGDWDIVIVPHSSFGLIGISPETETRYLEAELAQAVQAIKDAQAQAEEDGTAGGRFKPFGVKEAERLAEKITARMEKLAEGARDRLLTFEQLGVDDLTIDEAHEYKNLYYSSNLTGVRGMGNKTGSRKASDLYNKVRILQEHPTGSVTFLTGTPISNSAVEMYTMMRYLAPDSLQEMGLSHFDAFRAQFVEATPRFDQTDANGLKQITRLGRNWSNMRSLMDLYYQFTDAVSLDDIKAAYQADNDGKPFPVPKIAGGKDRQAIVVKPTAAQEEALVDLVDGFRKLEDIRNPTERSAQRFRLMDRGRKLSLDMRAINPFHKGTEEGGKLQVVAENVKRIYDKWNDDKGTQLIFLDRSVPRSKGDDKIIKEYDALLAKRAEALRTDDQDAFDDAQEALDRYDPNEMAELRQAQTSSWNAYQQIKNNLIAMGIPSDEIRFIQEANKDEQKSALFDAVRGGKVRVLIGSTPRMGAGTNVQDLAVALHHVDVTWKPSDIEQREGRIIRQGNLLMEKYGDSFEVEVLAYATERTTDARMWDLNATKLRMINGIRKYTGDFTMEFEDEEAVGMAEMAALASGNPLLLERVQTDAEIQMLELQERAHRRRMWGIDDEIRRAQRTIRENPDSIELATRRRTQGRAAIAALEAAHEARSVVVEGKTYNTLKDALGAAENAIAAQQGGNDKARYALTIAGKRVTSKEAVSEQITAALGDVDPFEATLGGKTFTQRTAAAREIAEQINAAMESQDELQDFALGQMLGYELVADMVPVKALDGRMIREPVLTLMDNGETVASHAGNALSGELSTTNLRGPLQNLHADVYRNARSTAPEDMQRQMERAERDLPGLEARKGEGFPKAQELADKRARLVELVSLLEQKPETATADQDAGAAADEATETEIDAPPAARPAFSRGTGGTERLTSQLTALASSVRAAWTNAPDIVVVDTLSDPAVPESVRREDARQREGGAEGGARGVFYDGKVYLVAAEISNASEAMTVIAHEVLGHYGLRGAFGDRLSSVLSQVVATRGDDIQAKLAEYGLSNTAENRLIAAEEVLAEMAQANPKQGIVRSAIAAIRNWLRDLGFNLSLTDADIIANFIMPARDWVTRGAQAASSGSGTRLSRSVAAFYSALARRVAEAGPKVAPAAQWQSWLKNQQGVKPAEVEWTGLGDWLTLRGTERTTRAEVESFLRANGVQVEEVMLGGQRRNPDRAPLIERRRELMAQRAALPSEVKEGSQMVTLGAVGSAGRYTLWGAARYQAERDSTGRLIWKKQGTFGRTASGSQMSQKLRDELTADAREAGIEVGNARHNQPVAGNEEARKIGAELASIEADLKAIPALVGEKARFADYRVPGGKDYRELLLTLPARTDGKTFKSSHWDQPNVLAHVRFDSRTDADGKRVLFLHELQSDWAQVGRKKGFKDDLIPQQTEWFQTDALDTFPTRAEADAWIAANRPPDPGPNMESRLVALEMEGEPGYQVIEQQRSTVAMAQRPGSAPRAPFVESTEAWVSLTLKRMTRYATENGFDRVAIVNGAQAAEMFDLSQHVTRLYYDFDGARYTLSADGRNGEVFPHRNYTSDELDDVVGKELAQKIRNREGHPDEDTGSTVLEGVDLKVGGEGMHGFYDRIVPTVLKDVLKKLGGRPSTVAIGGTPQVGFDITPAIRDRVMAGLPMFSRRPAGEKTKARTEPTTRTDRAVMNMAREGRDAKDILSTVANTSATPFHRQLARALMKTGVAPTVTFAQESLGSEDGFTFLATYSRKNDAITLTPAAGSQAEHIFLHEMVHAATVRALGRQGLASMQMRRLYEHVQRQGGAADLYGMKNVREFVAEAFTNPEFQDVLRQMSAPPGGKLQAAWDGFVRILRSVLGLPETSRDALSEALRLGAWLMREDTSLRRSGASARTGISARGNFNPADPDMAHFGVAEVNRVKESALDQISQAFSHPGKVSIWDKTVGTMRNLSERVPAFKPVFDAAQRFVDDVAMLANDAADAAPRLMPRVDTWRDLRKKPITGADNKAVAQPLFEGTLMWSRDLDGTPMKTDDLAEKYRTASVSDKAEILLEAGLVTEQMLRVWQGQEASRYEAIINNKFEREILKPGVVWSGDELRKIFNLTDDQVGLYGEARAAINRSLDMTARTDMLRLLGTDYAPMREEVLAQPTLHAAYALISDTLQTDARENEAQADRLLQIQHQVMTRFNTMVDLMEHGYAPLSRFGRYSVDVVDADGERQYFGLFESMRAANQMAMKMRDVFPGAKVTQGTMSQQTFKLFAGITPESLEQFGEMLSLSMSGTDAQDKVFQAYLALAKNNHSALKRLIHRKGIAGYSEDVGRVLASFVYSNARLGSQGLNAGAMENAVEDIPKEMGELRDVAMGLRSYIQDPQEEGQAIRGMLFAQYLGGSVASAMVNASQPFQITIPWLSQYGGIRKSAAQVARALKDMSTKGFKYESDLAAALQAAEDDGVVSPQEIHQLMAQARGTGSLRAGDGTRAGDLRAAAANNWERVKVAWGQPFALAEQFNRRSTFIAAYRTAKEQKMADPAEFARHAVLETQFLYSKPNKMRWGRGAIGGAVMTFKTYSISYLELLHRMWNQGAPGSAERAAGRRAVGWSLAMLVLMAGAGGLPFMEDAEDLIDGIGQLMGYNISSRRWREEMLASVVGAELADFMEQGLSRLPGMPIDVSGRLGLDNLIPGTGLFLSKQNRERDLLEVAGPAGDLIARGFTAGRQALSGNVAGAALEVSPTAVRNAVKGLDMAVTGMYRDRKGYKVLDTNLIEAAAKAAGFQPRSVAEVQEANSFMQRSKAFYTQQSSEIKAQWAKALFEKDDRALARVRARLDAWNQNNPDQRIVVRMPDVWKRVREMGKDRTQRIASTAPKALRQQMREMAAEAGR